MSARLQRRIRDLAKREAVRTVAASSGSSSGGGSGTVADGSITLAKLASDVTTAYAPTVHDHDDLYYTEAEVADIAGSLSADIAGKANASHTHAASAVTDFAEAVDDRVAALLVAGTNITLTYNDGAGTLTVAASGGGSGLTHPQVLARGLGA